MGTVNEASITKKLKQYARSAEGKERMREYIAEKIENDDDFTFTDGGSMIVSKGSMRKAASLLIGCLQLEIAQYPDEVVPQSVKKHFDSLAYTEPELLPNKSFKYKRRYKMEVYFKDNLSRMSLLITSGPNRGKRTGPGVRNIVSLFDAGYEAGNTTYGKWEGHTRTVEGRQTDVFPSRPERDGLYFMEKAVDSFNEKWGFLFDVTATVISDDGQYSLLNG